MQWRSNITFHFAPVRINNRETHEKNGKQNRDLRISSQLISVFLVFAYFVSLAVVKSYRGYRAAELVLVYRFPAASAQDRLEAPSPPIT